MQVSGDQPRVAGADGSRDRGLPIVVVVGAVTQRPLTTLCGSKPGPFEFAARSLEEDDPVPARHPAPARRFDESGDDLRSRRQPRPAETVELDADHIGRLEERREQPSSASVAPVAAMRTDAIAAPAATASTRFFGSAGERRQSDHASTVGRGRRARRMRRRHGPWPRRPRGPPSSRRVHLRVIRAPRRPGP